MKMRITCLLLGASLLVGCSSVQIVGSGGGTQAMVGPILIEAWGGGKRLPKFLRKGRLHIVGTPDQAFALALKNRTDAFWKVELQVGSSSTTRMSLVLRPYEGTQLKRIGRGKQAQGLAFPKAIQGDAGLKRLTYITIKVYPEERTDSQMRQIVNNIRRRFEVRPAHEMTLTYGLCKGYRARAMYSKWCPGGGSGFFVPPARPFPEPYIQLDVLRSR